MSKRSTVLVVIGVAVFVLGTGLVLVSLHTRSSSGHPAALTAADGARTPVVMTTGSVAAGTTGETLIESKKVALAQAGRSYGPNDLTSLTQLEGQTLIHALPAGTPVQASDLSAAGGPLAAPAGDQTVAVTLNSAAAGLAGYLQPGDAVDVYGNVIKASAATMAVPCVTLVAPKVEVLDVSDEVPAYRSNPTAGGRSVPGTITVLLAVTPAQAPAMVFYAANEQIYLVASNRSPASPSPSCSALAAGGALVPVG